MGKAPRALNPNRSLSLDVFRGITIAGMILVNNSGNGKYTYTPLEHADWNGWTPTDLVFPFFVFIMGVSIAFSFGKRVAGQNNGGKVYGHIFKRTVILFLLGVIWNYGPDKTLETYRIMGVLQRLALVYFFASIITLNTSRKGQAYWAVGLMLAYWALMKLVSVPGYGPGVLTQEGSLVTYIDKLILHAHTYKPGWDPEGFLHTLPAISSGLIGVLCGHWLRDDRPLIEKIAGLFVAGSIMVTAGLCLSPLFPINKKLWSPTYVLFAGGLALVFLGVCTWFVDYKKSRKWIMPFVVLGVNSLAAYLLSALMRGVLSLVKTGVIGMEGKPLNLVELYYERGLASWAGLYNGSLLFALSYVAFWIGVCAILYKKRIFIKI